MGEHVEFVVKAHELLSVEGRKDFFPPKKLF